MNGYSLAPQARQTIESTPSSVFAAKVSRTDPIMVTLDAYGETHEWGPVTWLGGGSPTRGDLVLALRDDHGGVWAASDSTPLLARLDSLESSNALLASARVTADPATGVAATDGPHLQALIDAGAAAGGQVVHLRDHSLYVGNIVLKPKVVLHIPPSTTLRGEAGETDPVVDGLDFATLTGKTKAALDYTRGCPGAGVVGGGRVDGNGAAANCIRLWGVNLKLDCEAVNATSHGIITEANEVDSFADPNQILEGEFGFIKSHGHGGDGWLMKGPHDSVCRGFWSWDNAGWGYTTDAVAAGNSYLGGCTFDYFNSYLNVLGSCRVLGGGFIDIKAGAISGDGGIGLEFSAVSGGSRVRAAVAGHHPGVHLRGVNHKIEITNASYEAYLATPNDVVRIDGAGWCEVNIGGGSGNHNVLNFVSENGPNYFHGVLLVNTGAGHTFRTGTTPNSQTRIHFPGEQVWMGSRSLAAGGWFPVLPTSNEALIAADTAAATTLGSVTKKLAVVDKTGATVGYIPLYGSIT